MKTGQSSTHSLWHRAVAWILLLLLPVYAFGSSTLSIEPKTKMADNEIKAAVIDVSTYEANRALTSKTGSDASTEVRGLLLTPSLPVEGFVPSRMVDSALPCEKSNPHLLWRGVKTSLQLFFCVLLI